MRAICPTSFRTIFDGVPATHQAAQHLRPRRRTIRSAETYPGDAYDYVGAEKLSVAIDGKRGKRNQGSRAACAKGVMRKAADAGIELLPDLIDELRDGFGSGSDGEDRFDAVMGVLGMIAVVRGEREVGIPEGDEVRRVEGWILGRRETPRG